MPTYQFVNYPREMLPGFIDHMRTIGTGLGGPDIFLDDPGLNFDHPNKPGSILPPNVRRDSLTPSVMQANYDNTRHDRKGGYRPLQNCSRLAVTGSGELPFSGHAPGHFQQVLEQMRQLPLQEVQPGIGCLLPESLSKCVGSGCWAKQWWRDQQSQAPTTKAMRAMMCIPVMPSGHRLVGA